MSTKSVFDRHHPPPAACVPLACRSPKILDKLACILFLSEALVHVHKGIAREYESRDFHPLRQSEPSSLESYDLERSVGSWELVYQVSRKNSRPAVRHSGHETRHCLKQELIEPSQPSLDYNVSFERFSKAAFSSPQFSLVTHIALGSRFTLYCLICLDSRNNRHLFTRCVNVQATWKSGAFPSSAPLLVTVYCSIQHLS